MGGKIPCSAACHQRSAIRHPPLSCYTRPAETSAPMPQMMKAVVKPDRAPGLRLTTAPVPACGPTDVLVKIRAASICGTDLHIYRWDKWAQSRVKPPVIVGHEVCGEVV